MSTQARIEELLAWQNRRNPTDRNRTGSGDQNAAGRNSGVTSLSLPNIAELSSDDKALTEDAFFPCPT
jgi:hypothetical protein